MRCFSSRLDDAGIRARRFIDVRDGEKGTRTAGHQQPENWLSADSIQLSGNYGVHPGLGLIEFDVDDYDDEHNTDALDALPETFTVASPHTDDDAPGHRYYAIEDDEAMREVLKDVTGTLNPKPSWGEIKYEGQYVVGPGSQLDGCTKKWCDECDEPDGGYYRIAEDKPIATLTANEIREVLLADPEFSEDDEESEEIDKSRPASEQFGLANEEDIDAPGGADEYDEHLDEEDVREALSYINPDLDYGDWLGIGYALEDFFDQETAEDVFKAWSQGQLSEDHAGTAWDDQASYYVEDIVSGSSSKSDDHKRTIGTVIHHARDRGWDLPLPETRVPYPAEDGEDGENELFDASSALGSTDRWRHVRDQYANEGNKLGRYAAAQAMEESTAWMKVLEEDRLWLYNEASGVFEKWGKQQATQILEAGLGEHYSRTERKEIIDRLGARNLVRRNELNGGEHPRMMLCVGNGVVDLERSELLDHSPEYKFTRGLKWDYDPENADTEAILDFLDDVTTRVEDRDTILDHLGHGLMPGHPYRRFVIMYGPGANGKTQLQNVIEGFVGSDNAAGVKLSALTGADDFATGALPGKFVNIGDDEDAGVISDTGTLKSLTGGGTMRSNKKFEKQFEFKSEAAMFFSANEPPRIKEDKDAINERLHPIEMPYQFKGTDEYDPENPMHKQRVTGIAESLLSDDAAMRGLLLLAVEHAQQVIDRDGEYSMPEGPAERRLRYEGASDPIMRFLSECVEAGGENDGILKDDAYTVYTSLCEVHNERTTGEDQFKSQITQQAAVDVENWRTQRISSGPDQEMAWRYVRFAERSAEYMPERLKDRYLNVTGDDETAVAEPEDADEESEEDLDDVEITGSPVYGAVPISEAAESLTGYTTITVEVVATDWLGEEEKVVKAIGKDQSGAIDIVAYDEPLTAELEEIEDEHVVIKDAEVTEYDGTRQIKPVDGLTEISTIQQGVGYTAGEARDAGQDSLESSAVADGGTVDDDQEDGGPRGRAEGVREVMRQLGADTEPVNRGVILGRASTGMDLAQAEHAFNDLKERGVITQSPNADGDAWVLN